MVTGQFIIRCGGCVSILRTASSFLLIDSNRLPSKDIQIYRIRIDGETYTIEIIFANKTAFVTYLNDVFKIIHGLQGTFSSIPGGITYYNLEDFTEIEIMAIYLSEMRCYQVGTPDEVYSQSAPIPVLGPIAVDQLKSDYINDALVLAVFIGSQFVEPVASSELLEYDNVNIYVLVQQIPA